MKIRNGFVSNSSSSCYIIKFDSKLDIEDIISPRHAADTKVKAIGIKDCSDYALEAISPREYSGKEDFIFALKECAVIAQVARDGKEVAVINISYHDNITENKMRENNIEIVYNIY